MPPSDTDAALPEAVKPPRCAMCRTRMQLATSEAQANGAEKHVFQMPKVRILENKDHR